mgnify:CR=1 FL=1
MGLKAYHLANIHDVYLNIYFISNYVLYYKPRNVLHVQHMAHMLEPPLTIKGDGNVLIMDIHHEIYKRTSLSVMVLTLQRKAKVQVLSSSKYS